MASSSSSPWLYKAAAIASTVALTAGAGYVIYKYVLAPEPEAEPEKVPPVSMQELLTGGAGRGSNTRGGRTAGIPVRKTPAAPKPRAGPSLPARKSPAKAPAAAAPSAAATPPDTPEATLALEDPTAASTSSPSAAPAATAPAVAAKPPATAGLKACGCCAQPLNGGGLPQRCGQCKAVYYCSATCQKKHWPEHKPKCAKSAEKADTTPTSPSTPTSASAADKPTTTPVVEVEGAAAPNFAQGDEVSASIAAGSSGGEAAAAPTAESSSDTAGAGGSSGSSSSNDGAAASAAASAAPSGGLQGALVEVLRQAAERGAGTLDGAFEEAVMHFLGGKLPTALSSFQALQAAARSQGRSDLVLELHKWLGHTHTKLGNFTAAADAFRAGVDDARAAGNTGAQVDNAVGLGNLWKIAGKLTQAAEVLKEALVVAQEANSAGLQSEVLVALGNVVMAADPEEGLTCLQIAVKLREDEVAKAAETGDRAAMATGMMQAAAAMVNMAAALFATRRFEQAKQAYEQAMEIFELMEDTDKVIQVLINLANLAELQLDRPAEALEYRQKLAAALKDAGHPGLAGGAATVPCGVCKEPIAIYKARARGGSGGDARGAMVLLGCLHVQHDECFKEWCEQTHDGVAAAAAAAASRGGEDAAAVAAAVASPGAKRTTVCPTCKAPVPVMS